MCRQGIRRRLRQETRGSEGNLCPLTTQLRKYSPVRLRGGYFFILSYSSVVQIFIGFLLSGLPICITPCNSITQIPTRLDTGGGYFFTLSYSSIVQIFYWLPIYLDYPVQPDYANPPVQMRGNFAYFFLLPQEYFIYFFTSIIRRLLGISDHINCPKQFSSVNALPYRV